MKKEKEKMIFQSEISLLILEKSKNDKDYFKKLLWALEEITKKLNKF